MTNRAILRLQWLDPFPYIFEFDQIALLKANRFVQSLYINQATVIVHEKLIHQHK